MRKYSFFLSGMIFLGLQFLFSCKKTESTPDPAKPLVTVTFSDNFIKDQLSAYILVSDPHGKAIGDAICTANGKYPVYVTGNSAIPAHLTITIAYYELNMHALTLHLNSYTNIAPYGEWVLKGIMPDTLGHTFISLTNLPTLSGPIIYSNSGFSTLTFGFEDQEQMLYRSPDDLYIKIKTNGADKFKWATGIQQGGSYTVDMTDAISAARHTITFPVNAQDYDVSVSGFKDANYGSSLSVLTDRVISEGVITNSVDLSFPPSTLSGFVTNMMISESYLSNIQYFYRVAGAIPDQFVRINASVSSVDAAAGQASVSTSGTFTMTGVNWQFKDINNLFYDWNIYAPDTTNVFSLPVLSSNLSKEFPSLKPDSMQYTGTELRNYPNLNNYQEVMHMMFDPTHTMLAGDFEVSSVKKIIIAK
jgi:hypothetical protein